MPGANHRPVSPGNEEQDLRPSSIYRVAWQPGCDPWPDLVDDNVHGNGSGIFRPEAGALKQLFLPGARTIDYDLCLDIEYLTGEHIPGRHAMDTPVLLQEACCFHIVGNYRALPIRREQEFQ